jgi:predicted nuclease with TOPRIM domain
MYEQYAHLSLEEILRRLSTVETLEENIKDYEYQIDELRKENKQLEDRAYKAENRVEELQDRIDYLESN